MRLGSVLSTVDGGGPTFCAWADDIWDHPEVALRERYASSLLAGGLQAAGFEVERGVAGMPTAFVARYGEGRPRVALLGEFDALPGLSQARDVAEPRPLVPGGPGHGCGHNLLGVGAAAAALAVQQAIRRGEVAGSIWFFGCPAEETLTGKVFMVKAGLFADVDCALTWHPSQRNLVSADGTLAVNSARFTFHGVSAHAAGAPERGRSALDAAELMNVGANYLREHVPSRARLHYAITEGGATPNVVPARAQVWYYVRAPRRADVESIYARLVDIARGACLMTGTTVDVQLVCGCYDRLPNRVLGGLLQANLEAVGAPRFSPEEHELARRLRGTMDLPPAAAEADLCQEVLPHAPPGDWASISSDVGDVSHVVPLAQIGAATAPLGTAGHSWQNAVAAGSGIGRRGMMFAARVLAATACDLLVDPAAVAAARQEFARATAGEPYVSPVRDVEGPDPPG